MKSYTPNFVNYKDIMKITGIGQMKAHSIITQLNTTRARKGLMVVPHKAALNEVCEAFGLTRDEVAPIIQIPLTEE